MTLQVRGQGRWLTGPDPGQGGARHPSTFLLRERRAPRGTGVHSISFPEPGPLTAEPVAVRPGYTEAHQQTDVGHPGLQSAASLCCAAPLKRGSSN